MIWLLIAISNFAMADAFTERRISVGQKLFRTMLVANVNYKKNITSEGDAIVHLLYQNNLEYAQKLAKKLASELTEIHGSAVTVQTISSTQYLQAIKMPVFGVFITEKLNSNLLKGVIAQAKSAQHILFSPFEGDVEKGVMAGLAVEARVRPYVNLLAMEQSSIELKKFFIKVSKKYAP